MIPSFYLKETTPVSPFDTMRHISLLIRFSGTLQFHDHIRQRLLNYWQVSWPKKCDSYKAFHFALMPLHRSSCCLSE